MTVSKPDGYASVVPFLFVRDVERALGFYEGILGLQRDNVLEQDGAIAHAELRYQGEIVAMLAPAKRFDVPEAATDPAPALEILIYVEDATRTFEEAVSAGAAALEEPKDQPWGERIGRIRDPEGFRWLLTQNLSES